MTARGDHARYLLSLVRDELVRTDRAESLTADDLEALHDALCWLKDRCAGSAAQKRMDDELARQRAVRARERARVRCTNDTGQVRDETTDHVEGGLDGDAGSHGEGVRRVSVEATWDHVDQEVVR